MLLEVLQGLLCGPLAAAVVLLDSEDIFLDDVLVALLPHLRAHILQQVLHDGPVAMLDGSHEGQLFLLGLQPSGRARPVGAEVDRACV